MKNPISNVWSRVDQVMADAQFVDIVPEAVEAVAAAIPAPEPSAWQVPHIGGKDLDVRALALYELLANAVNYAYWYGSADFYPAGGGSVTMYECLQRAWSIRGDSAEALGREFIAEMAEAGLPWMDRRASHVREIVGDAHGALRRYLNAMERPIGLTDAMTLLVRSFPGYAADPFLKRASLFFIQMNRQLGFWSDEIRLLPVPADYQVPKMLRHLGVLWYDHALARRVDRGELIPEASREEVEIRAATIRACQQIAEAAGLSGSDVDEYLWLARKSCTTPFHLTVTTNY